MSKLIKGVEALTAIANGVKVDYQNMGVWNDAEYCLVNQFLQDVFEFRLKPNLLKIGDVEIEAPITELTKNQDCYLVDFTDPELYTYLSWQSVSREHCLKIGICHASAENAIAHAKALILVSGGEIPLIDVFESAPEPVTPDPEPAPEKKRRVKKEPVTDATFEEAGSIDISADLSFENITAPDIMEAFHVPEAINVAEVATTPIIAATDEPFTATPDTTERQHAIDDLVDAANGSARVTFLLDDIAKAKTGGDVMTVITRYTKGLNADEMAIVNDAAAKRNAELAGWPKAEPNTVHEPEKPSLAVRIQASQSLDELRELSKEIGFLSPQIQERMWDIYNQRIKEFTV